MLTLYIFIKLKRLNKYNDSVYWIVEIGFSSDRIFLLPTTLWSALRSTEPHDHKKNNNEKQSWNRMKFWMYEAT